MKHILRCMLVAVTFFSFGLSIKAISNIKVGEYDLVPYFSDYIMKYNVFVDNDVENINVSVTLSKDDNYATGTGNIELVDGVNEVIIKVIKKSDEVLTYQVNIFRNYDEHNNASNSLLRYLYINGFDINFDPLIYSYDVNIIDDERLKIEYKTYGDESTVRITGNSNLKEGKNEVRIIVTSKDKMNTSEYVLNVNKVVTTFDENEVSSSEESNILGKNKLTKKETNIITISIASICFVIIIFVFYIIFIANKKRH